MHDTSTQLAALIGSRICHDLISPIGAINNGLELLSMSGDTAGPEIGLIGESVGNASARIRFFRIAFGSAGDQMVGVSEVSSILRDLYATSRLDISWDVTVAVQRTEVRMAFLALLCAETALPYGGQVFIQRDGDAWEMDCKADRINVDPDLWRVLSEGSIHPDLPPSVVQFALLPRVVGDAGRSVKVETAETRLTVKF